MGMGGGVFKALTNFIHNREGRHSEQRGPAASSSLPWFLCPVQRIWSAGWATLVLRVPGASLRAGLVLDVVSKGGGVWMCGGTLLIQKCDQDPRRGFTFQDA